MRATRKISRFTLLILVFGVMGAYPVSKGRAAQKIAPDQQYLLLATSKPGTMQKELDQAAAQGFRVLMGAPTSGKEMMLVLQRVAEPANAYKYVVINTNKTDTLQEEMTGAAEKGFRMVPSTIVPKKRFAWVEIVVVFEQMPGDTEQQFEYLLLATNKTATLEKEVIDAVDDGYVLAAMVSRGEHMVVMERAVAAATQ